MSSELALKVNYEYGVYQIYEDGVVPLSDYKTCNSVIECKEKEITDIITYLNENSYVKA